MGYNIRGANPIQKGTRMKKRHILMPLAASAMMLPLTANACTSNCCEPCVQPACCTAEVLGAYDETPVFQLTGFSQITAADEIFRQVNAYRAQHGLSALKRDPLLEQAAAVRASEISQKFSHTRPDGSSWSTVSGRAFGENIARGHRTADKAMAAWMTSSGHRANILRGSFGSIGIAAVQINGVMHWVQLFGR